MWRECEALQDYIVGIRRALHKIPELGFDLPITENFIFAELDKLGIPYKKVRAGIVGEITGGKPGKTLLLRADTDALPVTEETGLPFASENVGKMHACGHDAHIAMLIGALRVINSHKSELAGTVRFIFQAAEETFVGAATAVKDGVLDGIDAVFGMHIGSILGTHIPSGTITVAPGCVMASSDIFTIKVKGKGCHGSTPEKGADPVTMAANIVLALQEIKARELPATKAAVLTIGMITGGFASNVIPAEVEMKGTIRTVDSDVRKYVIERVEEISKAVANVYRGEVDFSLMRGTPPLVNDADMTARAADAAEQVFGAENVRRSVDGPSMVSEDFSYFLEKRPGTFMFLNSASAEKHTDAPHHSPKFDVDEEVLWKGSAAFVSIVQEFLVAKASEK